MDFKKIADTSFKKYDLRNVLTNLRGTQENPNIETQQLPTNSESSSESIKKQPIYEYGEHIACVWYDDGLNCLRWYLGLIDQALSGDFQHAYERTCK